MIRVYFLLVHKFRHTQTHTHTHTVFGRGAWTVNETGIKRNGAWRRMKGRRGSFVLLLCSLVWSLRSLHQGSHAGAQRLWYRLGWTSHAYAYSHTTCFLSNDKWLTVPKRKESVICVAGKTLKEKRELEREREQSVMAININGSSYMWSSCRVCFKLCAASSGAAVRHAEALNPFPCGIASFPPYPKKTHQCE